MEGVGLACLSFLELEHQIDLLIARCAEMSKVCFFLKRSCWFSESVCPKVSSSVLL